MDAEDHQAHGQEHAAQGRPLAHLALELVQIALAGHGAVPGPGQEFQLRRDKMDGGKALLQLLSPGADQSEAPHAEAPGDGGPVHEPHTAVHGQNGPAHSVGVGAEIAEQYGEHAAAHAKDGLSQGGDRSGGVVRGHKDSPHHQSAAAQLGGHPGQRSLVPTGEQEGKQGHCPQIGQRNPWGDDPPGDQIQSAQQQHEHGDASHGAAVLAQQHLPQGQVRHRSGVEDGHGGGGGGGVHALDQAGPLERVHPAGHQAGEGTQQGPPRQGGVEEVAAQPSIKLLDDDNGKQAAQDRGPVGSGDRKAHSQQQAGDAGGQVADGIALSPQAAVAVLGQHTGAHGYRGQSQYPDAEQKDRHGQGGDQGDDHVQHGGGDGGRLGNLGGGPVNGGSVHACFPPSAKMVRACRTRSARGIWDGQI